MNNIRNLCKLLRLFWKRQTHLSGRSSITPESRYSPEQGFAGGTTCPSAERQSWVSSTATDGGGRRASKFSCHVLEKVFRDCVSLLYGFSHSASSVGKKKKKEREEKGKRAENGHPELLHESECLWPMLTVPKDGSLSSQLWDIPFYSCSSWT